ncbi:MAG: glutamine-hydrolyzing GMP synthase [Chitinispirillaceae bacterium]|nr:glutamine-hydrolyzing GMP synthase [Chitinispirillaceae bacterium]
MNMNVQHENDRIAVLDFGGQYAHLIANRIRRLGVYSEIAASSARAAELSRYHGIIFSGSPFSCLAENSPRFDPAILDLNLPTLGLCYGHQLLMMHCGGKVGKGSVQGEYGRAFMKCVNPSPLFDGLDHEEPIWMSHGDMVLRLPEGFTIIGSTSDCHYAAVADEKRKIYGLQFHPEVTDTPHGMKILDNFLRICGCEKNWSSKTFLGEITRSITRTCGERNVFLFVSGGVDSTVAFTLLNRILGPKRVLGLHIDNGLMRHRESIAVLDYMREHGFDNIRVVDATADFLGALAGITDPEKKREIIGAMFLTVKDRALADLGLDPDQWVLAQGTIYPDTIESAGTEHADRIKTHHNRVDPILELIRRGRVIEPLAQLYKDEVRELGTSLGLPHDLIWRHPFPGPGLGVRILCSDGAAQPVPEADRTGLEEIVAPLGYRASILYLRSVGVQGDERTYAHPALIEGTCDWEALDELSTRITNSVRSINRVVYRLTGAGNPSEYRLIKACVTEGRLDRLRAVDDIVTRALRASGEYDIVWQMPVVLLPLVDQQERSCVVLRPIVSQEAMTARFTPLRRETIDTIIREAAAIDGIGDLFFDITHKPPGTIEWE